MMLGDTEFREVTLLDFEFLASPGGRPEPICLVAKELVSGRTVRLWQDELSRLGAPPYPTDDNSRHRPGCCGKLKSVTSG